MSVEALAAVLHHSRAKGTAKLVLLGIANHDGDGGAWPTVATLSKYAHVDVRTVQRAIGQLVKAGELYVDRQAGGLASAADCDRPNLYHVRVRCPVWCDGTPQHRDQRRAAGHQAKLVFGPQPVDSPVEGVTLASPGDTGVTPPGDTGVTPPGDTGVTLTVPTNTPIEHRGAPTVTSRVDQLVAQAAALPSCDTCGKPASRCLATPEKVSGHRYAQPSERPPAGGHHTDQGWR